MKITRFIFVLILLSFYTYAQRMLINSDTLSFKYANEEIKASFENLPLAAENLELIIYYKVKVNPISWRFYSSYCCSEKNGRCLESCTQEEKGTFNGSMYCRFPYDKQNYFYLPPNESTDLVTYTYNLSKDSINQLIQSGKKLTIGIFSPAENYSVISNNYYYIKTGNGVNLDTKPQVIVQLKYNSFVPLATSLFSATIKNNILEFTKPTSNCKEIDLLFATDGINFFKLSSLDCDTNLFLLENDGKYQIKYVTTSGETIYGNIVDYKVENNDINFTVTDGLIHFVGNSILDVVKITNIQGQELAFDYYQNCINLKQQLGQVVLVHYIANNSNYKVVKIKIE